MALSPAIAVGEHDPLSGLLFSPCAAFIWNNDRRTVAWMNGAARDRFKLGVQELSAALSKTVIQRLTAFFDSSKRKRSATLKIKLGGVSSTFSTVAPLKLAAGDDGLIIAEVREGEGAAAKVSQNAPATLSAKKPKITKQMPPEASMTRALPARALTPEEWQSFRAIGRRVRKLCREKLKGLSIAATPASSPAPLPLARSEVKPSQAASRDQVQTMLCAFDMFLLLDEDMHVFKVESRSSRPGWRKASLQGMPMAKLFLDSERAILNRLVRRVAMENTQISREVLVARNGAGEERAYRVTLGRWPHDGASYFLAMISLEMPQRLKRREMAHAAPRAKTSLAA